MNELLPMEFIKYPKIGEGTNNQSKSIKGGGDSSRWMVSEKIHGCNFSIYCNGIYLKTAKRNSFVDSSCFYNFHPFLTIYGSFILEVFLEIQRKDNTVQYIIVYGELFGGWYPSNPLSYSGPLNVRLSRDGRLLVPQNERAIQEGVYYCPEISFMAFDLYVVYTDKTKSGFLPYSQARELFLRAGVPCVEPLMVGRKRDVMNYDPTFDSTIPARLRQPALPPMTNLAEGIVIRPYDDPSHEHIYKIKIESFREVSFSFRPVSTGGAEDVLISQIVSYANINRYNSAVSKIGPNNTEEVLEEFINDTMASFMEDFPETVIRDYKTLRLALEKEFYKLI